MEGPVKKIVNRKKRKSIPKENRLRLDGDEEDLLRQFLESINNSLRSEKDIEIIFRYLLKLTQFVDLLKGLSEHFLDLISNISKVIKYEHHLKNYVLFRQGDTGNKFYIILKGSVSVFIAKPLKINMSKEEYYSYLIHLRNHKEFSLLQQCVIQNNHIYYLDDPQVESLIYTGIIQISNSRKRTSTQNNNINFESKNYEFQDDENSYIRTSEYPQKLKFNLRHELDEVDRSLVEIYEYNKIVTLKTGFKFGDLAITSQNKKRVATIILEEDCYFGILDKKSYDECLQEVGDKEKKNKLNFLLGNRLFKECKVGLFMKEFLNFFVKTKVHIHQKVITEEMETDRIYFVKSGEFQISMKKSLIQINDIIKSFGFEVRSEERHAQLMKDSAAFLKLMREKKLFKISIINDEEILGLSNMIMNGKYIFEVECVSPEGEIMIIERKFFENMLTKDNHIEKNTKKYIEQKKGNMLDRIIQIRKNKLENFFTNRENIFSLKNQREKNENNLNLSNSLNKKNLATSIVKVHNEFKNEKPGNFTSRLEKKTVNFFNEHLIENDRRASVYTPILSPLARLHTASVDDKFELNPPLKMNSLQNKKKENELNLEKIMKKIRLEPNPSSSRNSKKIIFKRQIDQIYSTFYKYENSQDFKIKSHVNIIDPLASDKFQRVFNTEEYFKLNKIKVPNSILSQRDNTRARKVSSNDYFGGRKIISLK